MRKPIGFCHGNVHILDLSIAHACTKIEIKVGIKKYKQGGVLMLNI